MIFSHHRCPHNPGYQYTEWDSAIEATTAYRNDYDQKHVEKATAIRYYDNLRLEGSLDIPQKPKYESTPRSKPFRPQDNLKPEGDFERPAKSTYNSISDTAKMSKEHLKYHGDRAEIVKRMDNLHMEGEIFGK